MTPSRDFSVVAIIAAYNEADVIAHVVGDLVDQGVQVYLIDDDSTDGTAAAVESFLGRGLLAVERVSDKRGEAEPGRFHWERMLRRKSELAQELDASWFIHNDADEFRESPWPHLRLREAIELVDTLGFNAIDATRLDFWPTHDGFVPGDDVRTAFTFYEEPKPYDRLQIRCWKKTAERVDLASSGGHEVKFPGRNVFPLRFILRHYPVRGQAHGERKIFAERRQRFLARERERGWHVQYDDVRAGASLLRDPATLTPYEADTLRAALMMRHRGIEDLEGALEALRRVLETSTRELETRTFDLDARTRELQMSNEELARARADLERRSAEIQGLQHVVSARDSEIESLRAALAERSRRIDELYRSLSWRWTAPARAVYRMLRGLDA